MHDVDTGTMQSVSLVPNRRKISTETHLIGHGFHSKWVLFIGLSM